MHDPVAFLAGNSQGLEIKVNAMIIFNPIRNFCFVFISIHLCKCTGPAVDVAALERCASFNSCTASCLTPERFLCFQARQAELEAARLVKEKEEEEAKLAAQQAKKEKEIQKKAVKKERQKLRTTCKVCSRF